MKTYNISRLPTMITLGYDGENNWRPHSFDCSPLLANHPNGTISLWLLPNGETQAFPVALTRNGNSVVWTPLSEEMTAATGALQLVCTDGTDVGKSTVVLFRVDESIVPGADHPATVPSWATETIERAESAAERAEEAAESIDIEQIEQTIADAVEEYLREHPVDVPVQSVNGKTGAVSLDAEDVGALPSDTPIPSAVTEQDVANWGFTKNTGTYSKPSGGIPKTDLASSVQATLGQVATNTSGIGDLKSALDPLLDENNALTADYQCVGYYYNSGVKRIMSSANLETFKYNIPDDCVTVRIQSNFYASQIMLSNTDTTSATFPSMSINLNEIALRPATAPGSATNVDITYIINDDNRYKYLYVPHYVGDTNPVVVTATMRGEISSLTYEKIDAAGRYRRTVPTGDDIFTSDGFTSGYLLSNGTGGTTENPNYGYTDYIDIEGDSFTLDGISGNGFSVVYDENKNPLGSGAISLFFDKNDRPDGTKYIRFNVYLANLPSVKMNVYDVEWITYITPSQVVGGYTDITVGTGKQFTSVVEAVEYANSIASDYNTVNVYIYPGTYDIIGDYDLSEQVSSWNGLTLADYVNLIGVGSPDKVVLNGELLADVSSYAFDRNNVSTLNFWKNNNIKNLTITAKNMRYCLHNEDGKVYAVENAVETIDNCVFIYYENDTGIISSRVPVGIGAAAGRKTTFRNCVFDNQSTNGNYALLLHNNTNAKKNCEWFFESCNFIGGTINSLKLSSAGSGQTEIVNIIGCRLPHNLRFDRQNVYTGMVCEYKVFGHGNAISGTASWDGVVESASVTEMLIE